MVVQGLNKDRSLRIRNDLMRHHTSIRTAQVAPVTEPEVRGTLSPQKAPVDSRIQDDVSFDLLTWDRRIEEPGKPGRDPLHRRTPVASRSGKDNDHCMLVNGAGPMEILIADDDQASRQYLELVLRALQHSATSVENGAQVLEMLEQFSFDAVLLDIEMPVLDGVETLRRIRSMAAFRAMPVYAITGHTDGPEMAAARQGGFSGILSKPFSPGDLAGVLAGKDGAAGGGPARVLPLVDGGVFQEYQTLLRGAGMSPAARVKKTLMEVSTWIEGRPDCVSGSRDKAHSLAGSCAVIGAFALRTELKGLERLAAAGEAERWLDALGKAEQTARETAREYGRLLSGLASVNQG
jgi:CheY-like chemotaxis protein